MMKVEKFLGWILLIFGVLIIFWSLYNCYLVFTKKATLPEFLKTEKKLSKTSQKIPQNFQEQIEKKIEEKLEEIFPSKEILKFFNFLSLSVFYGVFIFGGGQIASLGVKLLKK